jgi:SpoVK/Ycf46/Vps4 family AAA+-type ATPase
MRTIEPILEDRLTKQIENACVMFQKKTQWKSFGMDRLREMGAAMLFYGEPGTGKTITARKLAKTLGLQMHELDFSEVGSDTPGELARNIKKIFTAQAVPDEHNNPSMVFIDECDTMLLNRAKLGHNHMWMLEPINALLREIGKYPGLVVLATNADPDFLDPALERRLIGKFKFGRPDFLTRVKLWQAKYPKKLPVKLGDRNGDGRDWLQELSRYELTGAEIETALILWVSATLRQEVVAFNFVDLVDVIRKEIINVDANINVA